PAHKLRPMLDDRHAATEATVRLGQFETDIATPEYDQMWRQVVEIQSLNIGERLGSLEARNTRDCRMRADVEEHLVTRQHARPAVIQAHFECFRRNKAPSSHDQFGS